MTTKQRVNKFEKLGYDNKFYPKEGDIVQFVHDENPYGIKMFGHLSKRKHYKVVAVCHEGSSALGIPGSHQIMVALVKNSMFMFASRFKLIRRAK